MATTTIISSVTAGGSYPTDVSISASNGCGSLCFIPTADITEQMTYELPAISVDVIMPDDSIYTNIQIVLNNIQGEEPYIIPLYELPSSCSLRVMPLFDKYAFEAHNENIECGFDGTVWDTPTATFPISVVFDDTDISSEGGSGGGGGGSVPMAYTKCNYIETKANTPAMSVTISGDSEAIFDVAFTSPAQKQVIGYELAANTYWGINIADEIAAEWSINTSEVHGISGADPTQRNEIHINFTSNKQTELTIKDNPDISYGYNGGFVNYSSYSTYLVNACSGVSGSVPLNIWGITFKQNGQVVHNLIPCTRNFDSAIGLYDEYTGIFQVATNAVAH